MDLQRAARLVAELKPATDNPCVIKSSRNRGVSHVLNVRLNEETLINPYLISQFQGGFASDSTLKRSSA